MKYIGWLIVVLASFALGQILYPAFQGMLMDQAEGAPVPAGPASQEVLVEQPVKMTIQVVFAEIQPEELPEKVTLHERVKVSAPDGNAAYLEAGAHVEVRSLTGSSLLIGAMAGGPLEGITEASSTDLARKVAQLRVEKMFPGEQPGTPAMPPVAANQGGGGAPTPAPVPTPAPEPTPPPAPEPTPTPAPEPTPTPAPEPTPTPAPEPTPTPSPTPAPEPAPEPPTGPSPDQIVGIMKASIGSGRLKEFTMNQVVGWKATEDEEVDGTVYQTGLAAYKAETIFGVKTVQAKALIKDGKVEKWVYAKTGMEIR